MRWGLHGELPRQAQLFWSASCGTCVIPLPLASSWPASGRAQCQSLCALRRGCYFFIQSETSQWCGTALSNKPTHAIGPFFTGRSCVRSWTVQTHCVLPAPPSTKVSDVQSGGRVDPCQVQFYKEVVSFDDHRFLVLNCVQSLL